jgi:hypothetical protein
MPTYAEMGRRPLVVDASLSFRVVIVSRECCSCCTLNQCLLSISKRLFAGGEWVVANAACESVLCASRVFLTLFTAFLPDPLKCYVPYDPNAPHVSSETREIRFGPSSDGSDQSALFELSGYKEGRFMKRWESRIKHAVMRGAGTNGNGQVRGQPESLGDALLADREDAEGRQVIRALDGYESA